MPLATCKQITREHFERLANERWTNLNTCRNARLTWPVWNTKRTKELLTLNRRELALAIGVFTGHLLIGTHAERLAVAHNDFCRSCEDEEEPESIQHLLCNCPALMRNRHELLGSCFLTNLTEVAKLKTKKVICFVESTKWFSREED